MVILQWSQFDVSYPSKDKIKSTFGLKAAHYDEYAHFQQKAIMQLHSLFKHHVKYTAPWFDLGSGTGFFAKTLHVSKNSIKPIGIDLSFESLKLNSPSLQFSVQADIEKLPIKEASANGFIIASVLQWIPNQLECIKNLYAHLQPEGVLLFSIFIDGSFHQLNTVKNQLGLKIPFSLLQPDSFLTAFEKFGFSIPEYQIMEETYYFQSAFETLKSISNYGGTAEADNHLSRRQIVELCSLYEKSFKESKGIPITYKALTGIAKKVTM